uniref:Uncharacterized protein n=1 Tax=viral metagenome TaxID=1070528 RepID=A0A6C0DGR7_9ZZZZ
MTSTIDNELGNIETKLNNDKIRVDELEKGINGLKGRNTNVNNQSVRTTVTPTVPPLNLQNISPNSTPSSSRSSVNKRDFDEQHKKEIRKARYIFLVNHPNEREYDEYHVKEFKDLTKEFSNSTSGSSTQRGPSTVNNTSRVLKSNSSRGGGKKTRKNKRRRTKKNSKCHRKRRSLKKRH